MSNNWGGSRAGAGRPSMGDTKRRITDLPIEIDNFVVKSSSASKKTVSAWIRELIQTEMEKQMLSFDGTNYRAKLEDGRTIVVDGDMFAEARHDRVHAMFQDRYPGLDQDELNDVKAEKCDEFDVIDDEVYGDLIQVSEWLDLPVESDAVWFE